MGNFIGGLTFLAFSSYIADLLWGFLGAVLGLFFMALFDEYIFEDKETLIFVSAVIGVIALLVGLHYFK